MVTQFKEINLKNSMVEQSPGAILAFMSLNEPIMNAIKNIIPLSLTSTVNSETPEAKYWREKYEISTKHLMVAVKEWGKLRQQVEEYRNKAA
jgi:hypothetical protein